MNTKKWNWWAIFWSVAALAYFFVPLFGTLEFSLRMERGKLSLKAYQIVLSDPQFLASFQYSAVMGVLTVLISTLIFLPTIYWIHLKIPKIRPVVEILTILPFIVPTIVYVFGLIRTFGRPPLQLTLTPFKTDILIMAGYVILSMPYMYRALDVGMRSIDVVSLTEAAQSLGANWVQIVLKVILPNMRIALLSGALICFATVIGELILGDFLVRPALGPYMVQVGRDKAYEPAALGIMSYALTWICLGLIEIFSQGNTKTQQLTGR